MQEARHQDATPGRRWHAVLPRPLPRAQGGCSGGATLLVGRAHRLLMHRTADNARPLAAAACVLSWMVLNLPPLSPCP